MSNKQKLSVVLATFNEEKNIGPCLDSIKDIAGEIVVVDGSSTDKTREIAKKFGAQVIKTTNPPIFHINKNKAIDKATDEWILQLDADERVTPELAKEISDVIGSTTELNGYWIPRKNFFLGKFLSWGGQYPDYTLRLYKNGKGRLPAKDVHEQAVVEGEVGYLKSNLLHFADKSFKRYLERNSQYIDLLVSQMQENKLGRDPLQFANYYLVKPVWWFLLTQIRHKGILDGWQGIVFSFFSALRFPRAYWRYLIKSQKSKVKSQKLKVFIDAKPLETGHAIRGVGSYTRNLIDALKKHKEIELVETVNKAEIVHYPYFDLFFLTLPLLKPKPAIVTVHDVIPLIYGEHYKPGLRGWLKFQIQKKSLENVSAIITDSETSKKDIVRLLDISNGKIFVVHLAPNASFLQLTPNSTTLHSMIEKYKLPEKFVLYVGDVNYNKNICGLVRAFSLLTNGSELKRMSANDMKLVLVGDAFKNKDLSEVKQIFQLIEILKIKNKVLMPGFVPEADLVYFYTLATVYCQPSFYEGFGLPVLEAMARGCPVVAAKTQVLVEIAEGAALFVDPQNPRSIAMGLKQVLTNKSLKDQLIKDGLVHASKFSWAKTADATIDVYLKIARV